MTGAVVSLVDADGRSVSRTLSDVQGRFDLQVDRADRLVEVRRIGFDAREVALPDSASSGNARLDIGLAPHTSPAAAAPRAPTPAAKRSCSSNEASRRAEALWSQAREGFLAAIVAREAAPADVHALIFDRVRQPSSDIVVSAFVTDRRMTSTRPFVALKTAEQVRASGFAGFMVETGQVALVGPDADILMSPDFEATHCFTMALPDPSRPGQLGVAFKPISGRERMADIEGVLWMAAEPLELRHLDFTYVGRVALVSTVGSGGEMAFSTAPNGVVVIDRWTLRFPIALRAGVGGISPDARTGARVVREQGANIISASWADSARIVRPLMSLDGIVRDRDTRQPVSNAAVVTKGSAYGGLSGTDGFFRIDALLPGRYPISAIDSSLAAYGLIRTRDLPPVQAAEGAPSLVIELDPVLEVARERCGRNRLQGPKVSTAGVLLARVVDQDGAALAVPVSVLREIGGRAAGRRDIVPDAYGTFAVCGIAAETIVVAPADTTRWTGLARLNASGAFADTLTLVLRPR